MAPESIDQRLAEDTYLRNLPPNTKTYLYKGLDNFWSIIKQDNTHIQTDHDASKPSSQYIVFTNISQKTLTEDFNPIHHKESWRWFSSYSPLTSLLLIKFTTRDTERAHCTLNNLLITKLVGMNNGNLPLELDYIGKAEMQTAARIKKPDAQFAPRVLPAGRSRDWPSMVMEAGYEDSGKLLEGDAKWWIEESKGDVRIALTISVDRWRPEIVIQQWGPRPLAMGNVSQAEAQQRVVISTEHGQSEVNVTGSLALPFNELFLRPPAQGETDIVFADADLKLLGRTILDEQGFP